MAVRRTWYAKLKRAEKHLSDFKDAFFRLRDGEYPYRITREIETHDNVDYLTIRGFLYPLPDDGDDIAAIAGDFAANVRDALDHICAALTSLDDAHFPIYEDDIWKRDIDPATRKDRNKPRRDSFQKNTRNMPAAALAHVRAVQPYRATPQTPELNPLATIRRMSNADKHRTLMVISANMFGPRLNVTIPGTSKPVLDSGPGRERGDGAVLGSVPVTWPPDKKPHVEARGGVKISLQEAPPSLYAWDVPSSMEAIAGYIRSKVIDPLNVYVN
jgi:enamine deaminase RidA (YjgF/YER057c/UK114 family)